jgi:arylsulfatase
LLTYWDWFFERDFLVFFGSAIVTQFLQTFKEFPPRHEPASFSLEHAVDELHTDLAARGG